MPHTCDGGQQIPLTGTVGGGHPQIGLPEASNPGVVPTGQQPMTVPPAGALNCCCAGGQHVLPTHTLGERQQFGKPLAEFQGLQFMVADMAMKLEAALLLTWQAAMWLDREPESRSNPLKSSEG